MFKTDSNESNIKKGAAQWCYESLMVRLAQSGWRPIVGKPNLSCPINRPTFYICNYWLFIEFCAKCKLDHTVLMIQVDPLERNDVSTKHKSTKVKE